MLLRDDAAVQPFVKQHVGIFRQRLPRRKRAWHLVPGHRFVVGVQIFARLAFARIAVVDKGLLQQAEVVGFRAEIADVAP